MNAAVESAYQAGVTAINASFDAAEFVVNKAFDVAEATVKAYFDLQIGAIVGSSRRASTRSPTSRSRLPIR